MAETADRDGGVCRIVSLEEKPAQKPSHSSRAILGRYLLTPEIFQALDLTAPNERSGQIELTDALQHLALLQPVCGYVHSGSVRSIGPSRRLLRKEIESVLRM